MDFIMWMDGGDALAIIESFRIKISLEGSSPWCCEGRGLFIVRDILCCLILFLEMREKFSSICLKGLDGRGG